MAALEVTAKVGASVSFSPASKTEAKETEETGENALEEIETSLDAAVAAIR